jgi:hypothetical protein
VLSLKSNNLHADGGKALAKGLKGNTVITQLDISSNALGLDSNYHEDMSGVIALADAIPGMRALSVTNVMGNRIGKEQLAKLQEIMRSRRNLVSLCGIADDATEADLSGLGMGADGAAILASELPDKRALSVLSLKRNVLGTKDVGKVLGEMLKENSVLKELDLSDNRVESYNGGDGPGFSQELALGIKDNGALSVANVMGNRIGKEQLAKLQEILCSKPNLVSLCGVTDDATEADLSGLGMDADDAAILASELPDKGALSVYCL